MSTETTFFSYSRADSAFVLKLAKDLRDAGAELWLDQLDIKPGSHWDSSIEAALGTSNRLLVILSPASVESNNVMDEVSYALESNKIVIPVLLTECNTPFRLKRLQRIDFTRDYQTGLNHLLEALGHSPLSTTKKENEHNISADSVKDLSSIKANAPEEESNEVSLWNTAKNLNSIASYNEYLHATVVGAYKDEAKQLINQLEAEKKGKELDKLLWEKAKTEDSLHAYNDYKTEYPNGIYKAEASAAIRKIEEAEKMKKAAIAPPERKMAASEAEKKNNSKKYMIAGGIAVVIIVTVLLIMNSGSSGSSGSDEVNNTNPVTDSIIKDTSNIITAEQRKLDSLEQIIAKVKADSIERAYKKAVKDSMEVGKSFRGGKIFHIDETGEHGLIVSENDLNENGETDWYVAEGLCKTYNAGGFSDWYLPNKEELEKIFKAKNKLGGLPNRYYWSSTQIYTDGTMFELNLNTGYNKHFKKNNKFNVRAVRKF